VMGGLLSWVGWLRLVFLLVQVVAGLVSGGASLVMWREVSAPAKERAREVAGTLGALEELLAQLESQVERIPETSRRTKETLVELATSLEVVREEVDEMLGVADNSLGTARDSLKLLDVAADLLHGFADHTTWVPNRGFHDHFRDAFLYQSAALVRDKRGEIDLQLREARKAALGVRGPVGESLASVGGLLGAYAGELELMEQSVLPSLPPLLSATAEAVGGLAETVERTAGWIDLLCVALGGIGLGLVSAGLAALLRLRPG